MVFDGSSIVQSVTKHIVMRIDTVLLIICATRAITKGWNSGISAGTVTIITSYFHREQKINQRDILDV